VRRHLLDRLRERQDELFGSARCVLEVQSRTKSRVEDGADGVQVAGRRGSPAARCELVERVVVAGGGEHPRLADPDLAHECRVLRAGPDPRGRLDRRAVRVPLERTLEHPPVRLSVDKELGLADRSTRAAERALQLVDPDPLLDRERQTALLPVAVRRLGRPHDCREIARPFLPLVHREAVAREGVLEQLGLGRVGQAVEAHAATLARMTTLTIIINL
jgi:hypothetical protein